MRFTKSMRIAQYFESMARYGISYQDADNLRRIEMTLQRWSEQECGDGNDYASWAIERDEETDKPFMIRHIYGHGQSKDRMIKTPIADREKGALKRLATIMANYPELVAYHQTDPRGCALYILRKSDVNGHDISSVYTRGLGVGC